MRRAAERESPGPAGPGRRPKYDGRMQKWLDVAARLIATVCGCGYSAFAPGTVGSAAGVLLFWPMATAGWPWQVAASIVLFVIGSVAAGRVAHLVNRKDPGIVVVDEVVGQWVTLTALPFTPFTAGLGFLLFRVMDIVKPW